MKRLALIALVCFSGQARSAPIIYTFSGTGTGTIGATAFGNAPFLITAIADTASITVDGNGVSWVSAQSATVQVSGFGNGQFEIGLKLFQGPYYSIPPGSPGDATVGLSQASTGADMLDLFSPAFVGYNLATGIGPVSAIPDYQSQLSFNNISTSLGPMTLTSSVNDTFTATPVPEPSAFGFFGAGVALLGLGARHRKSSQAPP